MAGFIISLSKDAELNRVLEEGNFASNVTTEENGIIKFNPLIFYSTLADYLSVKENDNVYFFQNRLIYGIGRIVKKANSCVFKNYEDCFSDNIEKNNTREFLTQEKNVNQRWVFLFEPSPKYFLNGVDMDDVLKYRPNSFRMIRAFENRTFIKIDDEENNALKSFIFLRNKENLSLDIVPKVYKEDFLKKFTFDIKNILKNGVNTNQSLKSEMQLEAYLVSLINKEVDYVSHQVIASPFKPISYIDKMDIFAYKYLKNVTDVEVVEKYIVIELKKEKAGNETILQTMKYVDWVCDEYAAGDYSLIEAIIIANDFSKKKINDSDFNFDEVIERTFIQSTHPIKSLRWNNLNCYKYSVDTEKNLLNFEKVNLYDSVIYFKSKIKSLVDSKLIKANNKITINKVDYKAIMRLKGIKNIEIFEEIPENSILHNEEEINNQKQILYFISKNDSRYDIDKLVEKIIKNIN